MDNNLVMRQFDQIEEKVGNLIERCHLLEKLNFELSLKVKSLEAELSERVEAENKHSEQKALIRSKIDNILSRLDAFNENAAE